jgi:GrpB-like predicted nucleotidyltransferase (UPF0157 family)
MPIGMFRDPAQGATVAPAEDLGGPIRLVPHDPEWSVRFEAERAVLAKAIGEWAVGGIHHVGSTAIPGVDAEPIVDILVGTADVYGSRACVEPIARLGYRACSSPDEETLSFCKLGQAFELSLAPIDATRYSEVLAFRDFLRADRQVAIGYAGLKRDLAGRNSADRCGYETAKTELIQTVLACIVPR